MGEVGELLPESCVLNSGGEREMESRSVLQREEGVPWT